ncbi:HNH endonuclease [Pseudomonas aeruginosa]|uniref:HNH endonuclease n=1 Tax=Pseudomonas aeruginosa TaxID=287 RepID=UPI000F822630|nr:HNH endonuclease [Pseudomonas aeruginosa]
MIYTSERDGAVTWQELKAVLDYHPETGQFIWKVSRGSIVSGSRAGTIGGTRRYVSIMIRKRAYLAHRLAWLYMTCEWPQLDIDHIDGDPLNNSWANLRLATPRQNARNRKTPCTNKPGVKGVYWVKAKNRWRAQIRDQEGVIRVLGLHRTVNEAEHALLSARREMHQEFARYS